MVILSTDTPGGAWCSWNNRRHPDSKRRSWRWSWLDRAELPDKERRMDAIRETQSSSTGSYYSCRHEKRRYRGYGSKWQLKPGQIIIILMDARIIPRYRCFKSGAKIHVSAYGRSSFVWRSREKSAGITELGIVLHKHPCGIDRQMIVKIPSTTLKKLKLRYCRSCRRTWWKSAANAILSGASIVIVGGKISAPQMSLPQPGL